MYVDVGCLVRGDRRCGLEFDIQFNVGQEEVGTAHEANGAYPSTVAFPFH